MAYATLDDLKTHLGITGTSDDTVLQTALDWAQGYFERETGRAFEAAADTTRYYNPAEDVTDGYLWLDKDLAAVTSVTVAGDDVTADIVTVPRNDPPYWALRLKSDSTYSWQCGDTCEDAIAVTGKWAYSVTPPDEVKYAVIRLAAWWYHARTNPEADRPVVTQSGAVIKPSAIPADVRDVIEAYRRRVIA